jgi:hypothetical protein
MEKEMRQQIRSSRVAAALQHVKSWLCFFTFEIHRDFGLRWMRQEDKKKRLAIERLTWSSKNIGWLFLSSRKDYCGNS